MPKVTSLSRPCLIALKVCKELALLAIWLGGFLALCVSLISIASLALPTYGIARPELGLGAWRWLVYAMSPIGILHLVIMMHGGGELDDDVD